MLISINLLNFLSKLEILIVVISPDLEKQMQTKENLEKSLGIFLDLEIKIKYQGDSYNGPGNAQMNLNLLLNQLTFINSNYFLIDQESDPNLDMKFKLEHDQIIALKNTLLKNFEESKFTQTYVISSIQNENYIRPFVIQYQQIYEVKEWRDIIDNQIQTLY